MGFLLPRSLVRVQPRVFWGCSSIRLEHRIVDPKVASSSLVILAVVFCNYGLDKCVKIWHNGPVW